MPEVEVAVISGDPVGTRMAGPAIRALELARALCEAGLTVSLVAPGIDEAALGDPVAPETGATGSGSRLTLVAAGDEAGRRAAVDGVPVVIVFSAVAATNTWLADLDAMVIVDAYDPALLETLERFRDRPVNEQRVWVGDATRHLVAPLAFADAVLVASEEQRHLVIGMLAALGRLGPRVIAEDPDLRTMVSTVPFGIESRPPRHGGGQALRAPGGPIAGDRFVAYWGGGLYDWLDPLTLVEAVALAPERVCAVFLAGPHPSAAVGALPLVTRAQRRAAELGLAADRVAFIEEWVPYRSRADWLLEADVGVSLHHRHLETEFAYRTRILDYLWAGLPVVCSAGDSLSRAVETHGLGIVVPPGDPEAVAAALGRLSEEDDARRVQRRAAIDRFAAANQWSELVAPLVTQVRHPRVAADRRTPGGSRSRRARLRAALRSAVGTLRSGTSPASSMLDISG